MTEREFDQIRNSYTNRYNKNKQTTENGGYFAFFKLRCLICLILFLGIVVLDQQINLQGNDKVAQVMNLLNEEEITVEQCFNVLK